MVPSSEFEVELSGGHPNSLGNTESVVARVLMNEDRLDELIDTYRSDDPVVRLRVSNAIKRVTSSKPDWVHRRLKRLLSEVAPIRQASTHWTLAQIFLALQDVLSASERTEVIKLMKRNLNDFDDWIVINQTLETLGQWARNDPELRDWLVPRLHDYVHETRKSIAGKARRHLAVLDR